MLCYLALLWNEAEPACCNHVAELFQRFDSASPGWMTTIRAPGLALSCYRTSGPTVDRSYLLSNERGAILGRLFRRLSGDPQQAALAALSASESHAIIASQGRALVRDYWGRYVGFLRDPVSRSRWLIRDPTGALPCQHLEHDGIDVYFNRLEDAESFISRKLSLNRAYLACNIAFRSVCRPDTGLREVSEVLAGECVEHAPRRKTRSLYWDPVARAVDDPIEDREPATRLLHQTVTTCVHAWAACFDGIALRLSGGLDSSIVGACLRRAPSRPTMFAVTEYSAGSNSDERPEARCLAAHLGMALIEKNLTGQWALDGLHQLKRSAQPFPVLRDLAATTRDLRELRDRGAEALFDGVGGDELFFHDAPFPTATDFAFRRGVHPRLVGIAYDDAFHNRESVWHVLRNAATYGIGKRRWSLRSHLQTYHRPLVAQALREEARRDPYLLPLQFQDATQLPPAKLWQAHDLVRLSACAHNPQIPDFAPVRISPLYSQPVIELCLRIATYVLRYGGRDRAIARDAFAAELPARVLKRRDKGGSEEHLLSVLEHNRTLATRLLSDGFLVQEGFLDRARLHTVLSDQPTALDSYTGELLMYLSIEAWARLFWSNEPCCPVH